jgi:hypothetical protein
MKGSYFTVRDFNPQPSKGPRARYLLPLSRSLTIAQVRTPDSHRSLGFRVQGSRGFNQKPSTLNLKPLFPILKPKTLTLNPTPKP